MVEDYVAIQQVLNRYTLAASRSDWANVLDTFVDDGVWEAPGLGIASKGHDAIRASISVFVDQMDYFIQLASPAVIVLAGNTASAASALREFGRFTRTGEAVEVFGFYDDSLVRTEKGWKFSRRCFSLAGMNGTVPDRGGV